ncbi:uncharacterized protein PG986_010961 [Apiospora aurea]|uniref:Uncharacterized protein n=1 Tax=Apiospora aurea TaxID=335848 RepID=A0ABR1Q3T2_9PEZI
MRELGSYGVWKSMPESNDTARDSNNAMFPGVLPNKAAELRWQPRELRECLLYLQPADHIREVLDAYITSLSVEKPWASLWRND